MTGTTIGRYELLEKLGEGGMGVVYRARDLLLNRFAALKFLPDAGLDDDRKRRFLHEAQVASSLNHPHIVTIYEISLDPPREFIAMEYVPGRPLDAVIGPTGLPFKDVLAYAVQIADALAAAHAVGIVHRDVKPANVLISDAGLAKVLDFGLAKLVERAPAVADDVTRTVAISSSPRTQEGAIVGTVSYMSPEQAEGKPVDHRSDVFSFGAMLYEMLTGKRAFVGDSPVSTLAAILRADAPDLTQQLPDIPAEFNRVLRRSLEKSPDRRWQSMADVRALLEDLKQDLQSGQLARIAAPDSATAALRRSTSRGWVYGAAGAVGVAILAAAAFSLWRPRQAETPAQAYTFRRMTSDTASNVAPTISADGKVIAYSSDRSQSGTTDIWIQQVAGGEPVRLTSGLGQSHSPSFSPDGSRIVFYGGPDSGGIYSGGIYVVSTFGGAARRIADGHGPAFSPDGAQISYINQTYDRIMLISAMGGTPRELPVKHSPVNRPLWLPDGKRLLFAGIDAKASQAFDWYTVPVDGGEEKSCGAAIWLRDSFGRVSPSSLSSAGVLIYAGEADSTNAYRVPFDAAQARVTGAPIAVTMAPGISFWPTASADGTKIVFGYAPSYNTNLWAMNVDPASGTVTGEPRPLTGGLVDRTAPYPSPDGKRIAYKAKSGRTQEIRVLEVATGQEIRIGETSEATPPVISDDGTQVAYAVREKDSLSIYAAPVTGGVARRICTGCGRPIEWFGHGTRILYDEAAKNSEIAVLDVAGGKSTTILRSQANRIYTPRLSPDRRWLCFTVVTGARERKTYLVRYADNGQIPEGEWKPLTGGAQVDERQPFWSPDGRLLYFLSERDGFRCVWAVRFDPASSKVIGEPFPAHHLHQYRRSLGDFGDVADIGLSLAGKTMLLAVREIQANIWLAERKPLPAAR
ncbi:MAG TPA: protein kinase [Candidatus Acidoferrales bacterium]|nr:protein kinase [Candidatus Acidoferrales bacterium]